MRIHVMLQRQAQRSGARSVPSEKTAKRNIDVAHSERGALRDET